MNWEDFTLSDIRRLLAAIHKTNTHPNVFQSIIAREPVEPMVHGRVTLGTVVKLLEQLDGKTVLSDEDLAVINRSEEPVIVQPTLAELLAACHLDTVSERFTEGNFPLVDDHTTGPVEVVKPSKRIKVQDICSCLDSKGFTAVGVRRALEWRADKLARDIPYIVVVAGAIRAETGRGFDVMYPVFHLSEIMVHTADQKDCAFLESCRYLVVRK